MGSGASGYLLRTRLFLDRLPPRCASEHVEASAASSAASASLESWKSRNSQPHFGCLARVTLMARAIDRMRFDIRLAKSTVSTGVRARTHPFSCSLMTATPFRINSMVDCGNTSDGCATFRSRHRDACGRILPLSILAFCTSLYCSQSGHDAWLR